MFFLSKGFLDIFFQKHIFKILLVIACAYGIEIEVNKKYEDDCVQACLIDENGPDYIYTPIDILPLASNSRSSLSHTTRTQSKCKCFNNIPDRELSQHSSFTELN